MKTRLTLMVLLATIFVLASPAFSQKINPQKEGEKILTEGLLLFRLEKASWLATDVLLAKHQNLLNEVSGFLSYTDNAITRTIFTSDLLEVLLTVEFDSIPSTASMKVYPITRQPTKWEMELSALKTIAYISIYEDTEGFFKMYENTSPNLIPLIRNGKREVYVLTASKEDKLLIGNDYLMTFNQKDKLIRKQRFHQSLITLDPNATDGEMYGSFHTHVIKDLPAMTATDVCNFMLYADHLKTKKHIVMSEDWVSILETDKATLVILPRSVFDAGK